MDKMTHTKFNLNSFLMALSYPLDNIQENNRYKIKYDSKRVSYTAVRILNYLNFNPSYFSDIVSYSIIFKNDIFKNNLEKIPFNNKEFYKNEKIKEIIKLSIFIEKNIKLQNNLIINKKELMDKISKEEFDKEIKGYFEDLSDDMSYWLDMANEIQLPFFILNFLQDYTFECEYRVLIELSKLINEIVYDYIGNKNKPNIQDKAFSLCKFYNFDKKDSSRFIIATNLYNIGALFTSKDIFIKKEKLQENEYDAIKAIPYFSSMVLSQIFGFDDIAKFCSLYAEKLDSSGYPYQLDASSLSLKNRLLTILIIFQALGENRTYREKYQAKEIENILQDMGEKEKIDLSLVKDLLSIFKNGEFNELK